MQSNNIKKRALQKFFSAYNYLSESFYINHPNFKLSEEEYIIDVIFISLLTGVLGTNQLITGNYGLGKTTISGAVTSLIYSLPYDFIEGSVIQGHPHLTEEKIVGRLDFSKLSEQEEIIFSIFAQTPSSKILDEINRIPEGTQNMLLNFIESGNFYYLNDHIKTEKFPFFATANFKDEGNTDLTPPLLDRFDVSVEALYPFFLTRIFRANDKQGVKQRKQVINDPTLSEELFSLINNKEINYEQKLNKIEKVKNSFFKNRKQICFSGAERKEIVNQANKLNFSEEAELFLNSFFDHINLAKNSKEADNIRVNDDLTEHFKNFPFTNVVSNFSIRTVSRAVNDYLKLYTYLSGKEYVSITHILELLPYLIAHKLTFEDNYQPRLNRFSSHSLHFQKVKYFLKSFYNQEFLKKKDFYKALYQAVYTGNFTSFMNKYNHFDDPLIYKLKDIIQ